MKTEIPLIKLFKYEFDKFNLIAIIDDYQDLSWCRNMYEACEFVISINFNIPNASLFERDLFIQVGENKKNFGIITSITDKIDEGGKGSQIRTIKGHGARYILKRRIIKNLNNNETWQWNGTGESCIRHLIYDQCGLGAEIKRRLPIINDLSSESIGKEFQVSEAYSNLYDTIVNIATKSETGWDFQFENNQLTLVCYSGENKSSTVRFSTDLESLAEGEFEDNSESYCNVVYVGGKGNGVEKDIYEVEQAISEGYLSVNGGRLSLGLNSCLIISSSNPGGINRFESWKNNNSLTESEQYETEAKSILAQYSQTINVSGKGLVKSPYEFEVDYDVGDIVEVEFSNKNVVVQIISITESFSKGNYQLEFEFGKPIQTLNKQLGIILNQIQVGQVTKNNAKTDVMWYTIPTDTEMNSSGVQFDTIGFVGEVGDSNKEFKLYLKGETGAKQYHVYIKQLIGTGKLILTTGIPGTSNVELDTGTYVTFIMVDSDGNVIKQI